MSARLFSKSYAEARARFVEASQAAGFVHMPYRLDAIAPDGSALSIDVARKGSASPRTVLVVSSGTHGVEGFFGSAVQLGLLEGLIGDRKIPEHMAVVLIHGINPYGFAHLRRVNEDNVDLNRNFLLEGQPFAGAPAAYQKLDALLNPTAPPGPLEPFLLVAGANVLRHGFTALKNAVAQGQYDFPQGIFFGGRGPSQSQRILREHAPAWLGSPERVIQLDFHTGLGAFADYALCLDVPVDHPRVVQLKRELGPEHLQSYDPKGVLYEIRGGLGRWLESRFPQTQYDCLLAEFGTYPSLRVLRAMRLENCVHLHAQHDRALNQRAKRALVEVFCPASEKWRSSVVSKAQRIAAQAFSALSQQS